MKQMSRWKKGRAGKNRHYAVIIMFLMMSALAVCHSDAHSEEVLRILTWDGYVLPEEIKSVNEILKKEGYGYRAEVISPYAEGAEQMFALIRTDKCDITFLTLFFIKMQGEKTSRLLQAINVNSPRLTNYKYLLPSLTDIPMGLDSNRAPLYIPWGGGTYGFYADMKKVKESEIPASVKDLWSPKWNGKFSLNIAQPWYNIGLTMMSMGKNPFSVNDLILEGKRETALNLSMPEGELQNKTDELYRGAGHFWSSAPEFTDKLLIVSSWGPEIMSENAKGGNWKFIKFKEGNMVWLDTINFVKNLTGKKLEAAEIVANYFIGKKVQSRVGKGLSMTAASSLAESNPAIEDDPNFFQQNMFVPPFTRIADNLMKMVSDRALKRAQESSVSLRASKSSEKL